MLYPFFGLKRRRNLINTQALALNLLLSCEDKNNALEHYEAISQDFFSGMYLDVFRAVSKFYQENGEVPTLNTLSAKFSRSIRVQTAVNALRQVNPEDIGIELALEALKDEYAQQETLLLIQKNLLENIDLLSSDEIIDTVAAIPLEIERKLERRGTILNQSHITLFQEKEEIQHNFMNTGISNKWDSEFKGIARQEVVLLGGKRGGGKSVVCTNIVAAQYKEGNIAPYYTIEMTARETFLRIISVLAEVDALKVKNSTLEGEELLKLARTRANMFVNGMSTYNRFIEDKDVENLGFSDFNALDKLLMRTHKIDHPLIIIDDPQLKLATIDVSLSRLRSQYGDKLTMGVVDYLNEVKQDGKSDPYDWVYQKEVATGLKLLARKHDCAIISPYQVDDSGETRFSKSILDPVDMAFIVTSEKEKGHMIFASTKLRSLPESIFKVPVDWKTLKIHPEDLPVVAEDTEPKETKKRGKAKKKKEDYEQNPRTDNLGAESYELN